MVKKILEWWAYRSRVEVITGHGSDKPYLVRYHLINNRFFKLYLHYFLRGDLDDPHDHPWDFWTLMLQGAYTEEAYDWRTRSFKQTRRDLTQNRWLARKAEDIHRVVVDTDVEMDAAETWKNKATMTLFFARGKRREWGFVENYLEGPRWMHWEKYVRELRGMKR